MLNKLTTYFCPAENVLRLKKTEERSNYAEEKGGKLSSYILNWGFKFAKTRLEGPMKKREVFSRLLEQADQNLDDLIH